MDFDVERELERANTLGAFLSIDEYTPDRCIGSISRAFHVYVIGLVQGRGWFSIQCIASERPVRARLSVAGSAVVHYQRAAC